MKFSRPSISRSVAVALLTLLSTAAFSQGQGFVLHSFGGPGDGTNPVAGMVFDSHGNLYGTTSNGGDQSCDQGCGIVFQLTPISNAPWNENVLHQFSGADGAYPSALVIDARDALYGISGGGSFDQGTVYKLAEDSHGEWAQSTLHMFNSQSGTDGAAPTELIVDRNGTLYGTTIAGGSTGDGVVFSLARVSALGWREMILHTFAQSGEDGGSPKGLVRDSAGNLYGATTTGGAWGAGTIYELTPNHNRPGWTQRVLLSFNPQTGEGYSPVGRLVLDAAGNLYGANRLGGSGDFHLCPSGCGSIFRVVFNSDGTSTKTDIYNFQGLFDGSNPSGGLTSDASGNLYGVTYSDGGVSNYGCLYKLTPGGGQWSETVLYGFPPYYGDRPVGEVAVGDDGNLYVIASQDGPYGGGAAYQVVQ